MLNIDRLRLQLPPEYADRAAGIARLLADELATLPVQTNQRLDQLVLPPVSILPGASDQQVARSIAAGVQASLSSKSR